MRLIILGIALITLASIACQSPLQISSPESFVSSPDPTATLEVVPAVVQVLAPTATLTEATVVLVSEVIAPIATLTSTPIPEPEPTETPVPEQETVIVAVVDATATPIVETATLITNTATITNTVENATTQNPAYLADSVTSDAEVVEGVVTGIWVNLRNGPSTAFDIVGKVYERDTLKIIGRNEDSSWWQVCCDEEDEAGWMTDEFVRIDVDTANVEITYRVPSEATTETTPQTETQNDAQASEATSEDNTDTADEAETTAAEATDPDTTDDATAEVIVEPDEASSSDRPSGSVTEDAVNLRGGPSTGYDIVGRANLDLVLDIVGRNEDASWWEVCCVPGTETKAWIIGQFIEPNFDTGEAQTLIALADIPELPEPVVAARVAPAPAPAAAPAPAVQSSSVGDLPGAGSYGGPGGTNPLTGLPLAGERQGQRPVIVCINNDSAARPQFGTSQADVMYEYLMEGFSITRFSGIFYGDQVNQIGPVRSARLINYYMGALYDSGLLCSGASDRVRFMLKNQSPFPYLDIDLDDPANRNYSTSVGRDYRTRVRTSSTGYRSWLAGWGEERPANMRGFTFGGLAGGGVPATNIDIPYPTVTGSNVEYRYDAGSGRYLRFLDGAAHTDGNTGAQLALDNVIVQYVAHGQTDIVEDSLGSTSIRLNLFSGNRAILFRDGVAFDGTWQSSNRGDMPHFFDQNGQEIALKPGRTWISIVPPSYQIGY
ncbi:MAG: DUF3048 domain-containing protein [Chloroflexota bacterium]